MKSSFLVCALVAASHAIKLNDIATDLAILETAVPDATSTVDVVQLDAAPAVVPSTVVTETVVTDPAVVETVAAEPAVETIVVEAEPEVIIEDTTSLEDFFPEPTTTVEETIEMADMEEGMIPALITTTTVTESTVQMMEPELIEDAITQAGDLDELIVDDFNDDDTLKVPDEAKEVDDEPQEESPESEKQGESDEFLIDEPLELSEDSGDDEDDSSSDDEDDTSSDDKEDTSSDDEDDTSSDEEDDTGNEDEGDLDEGSEGDHEEDIDLDEDTEEGEKQDGGATGKGGRLGDKLDECTEGFDELPEETQTELTELFGDVTSQMNAILDDDAALV